jgi:hypothetical protein
VDRTHPEQVNLRLELHLNTGAVHLFGWCSIPPPTLVPHHPVGVHCLA